MVDPRSHFVMAGSEEPEGEEAYELSVDGAEAAWGGDGKNR